MTEHQIYVVMSVVSCGILFFWTLVRINKKKEPPTLIDVGKTTAYITMMDGTFQTVTREGYCSHGYSMNAIYRVERALKEEYVTMDSGDIYNRNQIISYRTETSEFKVEAT